jgi:hypothetical protein
MKVYADSKAPALELLRDMTRLVEGMDAFDFSAECDRGVDEYDTGVAPAEVRTNNTFTFVIKINGGAVRRHFGPTGLEQMIDLPEKAEW